ncbi:MAG: helix-turn-helix domain-containing protein [Phaeodactylibacter sp.]|nr:helix-turn-helix domain-containing protein [Phaeodactylibacter sp.]
MMYDLRKKIHTRIARFLLLINGRGRRGLFFTLAILCSSSCQHSGEKIPEPDYAPHILRPGPYTPAQGRAIDKDTVKAPDYVIPQPQYVQGFPPRFKPFRSLYYPVAHPRRLPASSRAIDMRLVDPPKYIPAAGKPAPSSWPEWRPAQPAYNGNTPYHFAYLDSEHCLSADMITCMIEARDGRIWAGTWGGGISIWDGAGFTHFTEKEGLSHSMAGCIIQATDDKIWIGTWGGGVNVWDGRSFTHFTEKEGLAGNDVRSIVQARDGKIWIGTWGGGVSVWDGHGFTQYRKENGLADNYVTTLMKTRDGRIWIGSWDGSISIWNGSGFTHLLLDEPQREVSSYPIHCMLESRDGKIWAGTWGGGIMVWDGADFSVYSETEGLGHNVIRTLAEGPDGKIWIGTQGNGVNVWDGKGFWHYTKTEGVNHNVVTCSLVDSGGNIWLGTWGGGINIWDAEGFAHISEEEGLGSNDIRSIMESHQGQLWVGTNGSGISILEDNSIAQLFGPGSPDNNVTTALQESRDGRVWAGTWGEGIRVWDGSGYIQYKKEKGLSSNTISCLMESQDGQVWAGTWGEGINVWDGTGFTLYNTSNGLADNIITTLLEARDGKVWAGMAKGVSVWDGRTFTNFTESEGLKGEFVWSLLEDDQGHIWIGTNDGGINVWDGAGFIHYTTEEGLRDNNISSMCQDKKGNIWVGTHKGLHRLSPPDADGSRKLRIFLNTDGLAGISIGKMLVDRKERLWMYTTRGVNRIDLNTLAPDTSRPVLAIRELQAFFDFNDWRKVEKAIHNGEDIPAGGQQFSLKGISFDSVQSFTNLPINPVFPHNINQLSLSWQAIQWRAPHQLQYSYLLEGQDHFWSPLVRENKVTFRDLRPGRYTFKARAVGGNNQWSETATYSFIIRPPWWWTNLAKALYLALGATALLGIYRYQLSKKLAEQEARQLKELDEVKSRFFTNISHEFRTPLTIISGMATQVKTNPGQWLEKGMELIQRNSNQLLALINQILDLRKLESGALKVNLVRGNIIAYLHYIADSFVPMAQSKGIRIHFLATLTEMEMDYDPDKMLQILSNLLSNAIKYTPGPGDIYVQVDRHGDQLNIQVKDTGQGIPPEALPFIFDQFYQVPSQPPPKGEEFRRFSPPSGELGGAGSGVGLALVKELVKLLNGAIEAASVPGAGTTFTLNFPITRKADAQSSIVEPAPQGDRRPAAATAKVASPVQEWTDFKKDFSEPGADGSPENQAEKPTLLIVEDNADVLLYLSACLGKDYQLLMAGNGQEGIDMAIEQVPGLIVSDVMMPVKDGFELCDTLKNDERTSHIPIVLLTARADFESKITGLRRGADAYLPKPFEQEELLVRLEQLLILRKKLQERYRSLAAAGQPSSSEAPEMEDIFIQKLRQEVMAHIAEEDFGIVHLQRALGISRTQLHNKIKALTGQSTTEFIRLIRLNKARELLQTTGLNVSEVGYEVGISNPAYFSRIYAEAFGETPRQARK